MSRVFAVGETLLDVIFRNDQPVSATPGGSMLNTAVSLGRLGGDVYFVSDYGQDHVGKMIDTFLTNNRVKTDYVQRYEQHKSGLALAFLDENNDAAYQFYKDFPVKRMEDIIIPFSKDDLLLFGSFFALTDNVREALKRFLVAARQAGSIIMYDPNFRKAHLHELDRLRPIIRENMQYADIVRGSNEDFEVIFGTTDAAKAWEEVRNAGCKGLFYTENKNGVEILTPDYAFHLDVPQIKTVSTIGAGDNFNAGILWTFLQQDSLHAASQIPGPVWQQAGKNGIAFSSDVCRHYENYISEAFAAEMQGVKGEE